MRGLSSSLQLMQDKQTDERIKLCYNGFFLAGKAVNIYAFTLIMKIIRNRMTGEEQ